MKRTRKFVEQLKEALGQAERERDHWANRATSLEGMIASIGAEIDRDGELVGIYAECSLSGALESILCASSSPVFTKDVYRLLRDGGVRETDSPLSHRVLATFSNMEKQGRIRKTSIRGKAAYEWCSLTR